VSQSPSATARALAVTALILGIVVLAVVVVGSFSDDDGGDAGRPARAGKSVGAQGNGGKKARTSYVVQNGDTLTSIAHKTGVPVARIEALNPGIDPQILISGEKLKLR
jgi:LysM repeat protein